MTSLADSLISSTARVLPMRMRPDLTAKQQRYLGTVFWVVKEPVGLHYYRFQEEEYAILQMLDGKTSLDEVKILFEKRFPPQKITVEELGQFVGMLHRSGLVIAAVPGQGKQLQKRHNQRWWKETGAAASNFLALRFRGIDPERLLNWLYPKVAWFYTGTARFVFACLALAALTLVLVQFDTFQDKLPTFHQFFEAKNWIYLGVMLGITKVLHEFGHGMTCKHYGGECHEMGIMFLVMTPCLYCNVSDSWMLPNKWHRAAIGAAGMYVELIIASICTFLWWFSSDGMLHQLALNTMFVCGVSTIIFNANPLLRYDGYYILSDILEIPNLQTKSRTILSRKMGEICLGLESPEDPFLPQRNQVWFALYTLASIAYRFLVMFGIIWFLYRVFEPYGLKAISQALAVLAIGSMFGMPMYQLWKFLSVPGRMQQVKRKNLNITLSVITGLLLFIFLVPLPHRIICPLELMPREAEPIHTVNSGVLEEINVKPGQYVKAGQQIGRLRNIDLELEAVDLESRLKEAEVHYNQLLFQSNELRNQTAALLLPEKQKARDSLAQQLAEKQQEIARLRLVASVDGYVLPPQSNSGRAEQHGRLRRWSGSPLDKKNLGAFMQPTMICQIGDPKKWDAMLAVDQDDIPFVNPDQTVAIKLDEIPFETFHTKVAEIGPEIAFTSRQLSSKGGGELMSKMDEQGRERPMNTSYQARAPLDDDEGQLIQGFRGNAKISAAWEPLAKRIWRYLTRTFNFKL